MQIGTDHATDRENGAYRETFFRFDLSPQQIDMIKHMTGVGNDKAIFRLGVRPIIAGNAQERDVDLRLLSSEKLGNITTDMTYLSAFDAGITVRDYLRNTAADAVLQTIYWNKPGTANTVLNRYVDFDITDALKVYFNDPANAGVGSVGFVLSTLEGQDLLTAARLGTVLPPVLEIPIGELPNPDPEAPVVIGAKQAMAMIVHNYVSFADKEFTLTYNTAVLELLDLIGQTDTEEQTAGTYGDVTVKSVQPGKIVFTVEKQISEGKRFTGAVNLFQFRILSDGNAMTKLSVIGGREAKFSQKNDLQSKGYEADEINRAMKKHVRSVVLFGLTDAQNDYILALVDQGYDYERLMEIYQFLSLTNDDLTLMKQIYDMAAPDFDVKHWIENAYESIKGIQSLEFEDVATYINQGIRMDEILFAYQLSLRGNCTERQILDARSNGIAWIQIAQAASGWEEVELPPAARQLDITAVSNIVTMANATGRSLNALLDIGETVTFRQEAVEQFAGKLERIDILNRELGLAANTDSAVLETAIPVIPAVDNSADNREATE